MTTILFTGGGSAGHVTPNIALIEKITSQGWQAIYVGSKHGIEKSLIGRLDIPYHSIATGKLRRYFSWQNFIDPFKILYGILQAATICYRQKPQVVFSKGGFVAFPVVIGAWLNRIPVIIHESDLTPGFANRLSFPFVKRICLTFDETKKFFPDQHKLVVTGTPIRPALFRGDAAKGRQFCGFSADKPILLIIGGGLGSDNVNSAIRHALPKLIPNFQIIHLCGKNKTDAQYNLTENYRQFEYVNDELADLFACADLVISRAGANSIYELLALQKLNILIPLGKQASRGDQLANARYFKNVGLSEVIYEEELTDDKLITTINQTLQQKTIFQQKLAAFKLPDAVELIYQQLREFVLR